jgi:hypothetical protein
MCVVCCYWQEEMLTATQVTVLDLVGGNFCSAYTASHNENPVLNKHHLSVFIVVRPTIISVSQ